MNFRVNKVENSRVSSINFDDLQFGQDFADHMLVCEYRDGEWKTPEIKPYGPLTFDPSLSALHYGQSIFEGMKAFYKDSSTVHLFRVDDHYERLVRSCNRMVIPAPPREMFVEGLQKLMELDYKWVPNRDECALYIRPFVFGTDPKIVARPADSYLFLIINSPVGPYYKTGVKPVTLTTSPEYVRAVKGGTGEAKTAGNYAASFKPAKEAVKNGYTQVLWLDAIEHRYVEEVGTMNIFFKFKDRLTTPALSGSVLSGINRRSVLELAREMGIEAVEERISIDDLFVAHEKGELEEIFGSGTAAVISPVSTIHHEGKIIEVEMKEDSFAKKMRKAITDIQYGKVDDRFGWVTPVKVG